MANHKKRAAEKKAAQQEAIVRANKKNQKKQAAEQKAKEEEAARLAEEQQEEEQNVSQNDESMEENQDDAEDDDYLGEKELADLEKSFDEADKPKTKETKVVYTKEKVPEDDNDLIIKTEHSVHKQPPFTSFIHVTRNFIKMTFFLHKVPERFIRFDATEKDFTIDTLEFTRKLYLKRKYTGLVRVDPSQAKAELKPNSILEVMIPITHMPQETFDRQAAIVVQKREARDIKFPPPVKKTVVEVQKKTEKKAAQKRRRKEKEEYFATNQDIKSERKKKRQKLGETD